MANKIFSIIGNGLSTFITDETSLKFSSSNYSTVDSFKKAFSKKISVAKKIEIRYDSIMLIIKEENDKNILIKFKNSVGIIGGCEFSFILLVDYDTFFTFLEKEKYFTRSQAILTPFKAIRNYLIGLLTTISFTIFIYYHATEIANNTVQTSNWKGFFFEYIVRLIGNKGILGVGITIAGYLIYKIWKRLSNLPTQIKFLPPNA